MVIKLLDDANRVRWDEFVNTYPEATFFHRSGWREVIESAFDHPAYFLYAEENGVILGILPLGYIKSYLFGNSLISTPFCVYGGIVASNQEVKQALDKAACELARDLNVDYLEFRNIKSSEPERPNKQLYVTFRKTLSSDHDINFNAIPRKQRAIVRKGISSGLTSVVDLGIERFYDAYAESVRNLGTPVLGSYYFNILKKVFGNDCEIISIEYRGRVISSVMNFYFRDEVLPYYGGGYKLARELSANDFMYWEVMRRAVDRYVNIFDYGRSKYGTGSYRFKAHWGFTPIPLHYEYELINTSILPDINPLNPKYKYLISAWKNLPLNLSKVIGPVIARNLG